MGNDEGSGEEEMGSVVVEKVGSSKTDAVWVYALNYGGGIVSGDHISCKFCVGDSCTMVLTTQGSTKRSEKCFLVWEVYEFMIRRRIYPNLTSLRIMVDVLCKEGELQKIVDTLDRIMRRSTFRSPSMIVNCSLMLRILERGRVAESESDVVVLLKRMLQKNLLHENVVWSLVLHAKVAFGDLDSAWGLYGEMVRRGFEPNAFVYTSFVGAFCRDGRVGEAISLVREMEGKELRPYGETYEHVVAADSEECVRVFDEMVRVGFVPGCVVFNKVVERLCEKGEVEKANGMLSVLMDKGFSPDDVTYSLLMQGYTRKEEVQEVLKLYYEMEYKRVNPGLSVFVTVVRCLCRCGKVEEAERYLRVMRERVVALDACVYEELIDGYIKKGDTARALYLQEELASLELISVALDHPNIISLNQNASLILRVQQGQCAVEEAQKSAAQ
ncbi:urease accessory protein [Vigna unguiculata]|uniref:Urease accessory protein n=1 Tax=Vigna unguiculata TaxID=3917 RepID=A0A4D6MXR6_VIGUN|nr:urease accessory protein [Vigna unguiculata]